MGEQFGRYRLDHLLGQGGMGVVYRAWDSVLERVVALKMVLANAEMESDLRERFLREARSAAQLSHRNIVTIYDLGEHEGRPFLAMEYLEGEDLQKRLSRGEKASLGRKLAIAVEICQGVEFAHAHGVVHRDLKPGNIFITNGGGVKILDFGLARFMSSQLTQSNMLLGTINYMSPEQVRGERADHQSDVFSVGVVLYELFSGRRAFEGDSAASTLFKILQEFPKPLWTVDSGLPAELVAIVDRALAKPRDERYPDMASLRRDLELLQAAGHIAGPKTPWPSAGVTLPATPRGGLPLPPSQPPLHSAAAAPGSAPDATVLQQPVGAPASVPPPSVPPVSGSAPAPGARGFWVGAGLGALAIAVLVVWMANRPVSPSPNVPQATPASTTASTEAAGARPTPPAVPPAVAPQPAVETPKPAPEAAQPRQPERRTTPKRASSEAAPPPVRTAPRGEAPATVAVEPRSDPPPAPSTSSVPPSTPPPPAPQPAPPTPTATAQPAPAVSSVPSPQPPAPLPSAQPAAPTAATVAAPVLSTERANALLQRYKAALEARSLEQLKRLWPSLDGSAEAAIRQEFQHASRISVDIADPQVSTSSSGGRIVFVRHYNLVTVDGQRLQSRSQATMNVRRSGDAWVIESIQFSPR